MDEGSAASQDSPTGAPSERTRIRRVPRNAVYERDAIAAILDEGIVAHLGVVRDGQPLVLPTLHARVGDRVYLHGSSASFTLRDLREGVPACLTVTLTDGLVLARSVFNHSVNYRSAVVIGSATAVEEPAAKLEALEAFSERIAPGRWGDVRGPTDGELKATMVLEMPLDEASAKIRSGPPNDDEEDYSLDCWAGVLPFERRLGEPQPDPRLDPSTPLPPYLASYLARDL